MKNDIWCNPLPLENYPVGMLSPARRQVSPKAAGEYAGNIRDFREMADPEQYREMCSRGARVHRIKNNFTTKRKKVTK